jgi:hypothetical protein
MLVCGKIWGKAVDDALQQNMIDASFQHGQIEGTREPSRSSDPQGAGASRDGRFVMDAHLKAPRRRTSMKLGLKRPLP